MKLKTWIMLALATLVVLSISACGGPGDKPVAIGTEEQATKMRDARKIFDKYKGDWNSVSAEEKSQFETLVGKEKATAVWEKMLNPYAPPANQRGGGSSTGPAPSGG